MRKYMSEKILKAAAIGLAALACCGQSMAGGIPVIDGAHIGQSIVNTALQLAEWAKQLEDMKVQIEKQQGIWNTLKGGRGMASILNEDLAKQYLPPDYWTTAEAIRNGTGDWNGITGSIKGRVDNTVKANQFKSCAELNQDPANVAACQKRWREMALQQEFSDMTYKKAAQNIENLQKFVQSINQSADQKVIAELQARIDLEQVRMQNEEMKLRAIQEMDAAAQRMQTEKMNDKFRAGLADDTNVQF